MNNIASRSFTAQRRRNKRVGSILRVIAPYALYTPHLAQIEENETFYKCLKAKPQILLEDFTDYLHDIVDLHAVLLRSCRMLKETTKATGVNLYLVDKTTKYIYLANTEYIDLGTKVNWKIEKGTTVAAHVALTMESLIIEAVVKDKRFPKGVAYEQFANSVICCPILTSESECYGVIELFKNVDEPRPFTIQDFELSIMTTTWTSLSISENHRRLRIEKQRQLNDFLINMLKFYFVDVSLSVSMIKEIVNCAKTFLNATSACVYLFEDVTESSISAKLYELHEIGGFSTTKVILNNKSGIIEHVARTCKKLNVKDFTKDPRFRAEQPRCGPVTKSMLCLPIINMKKSIGVVEVKNKKNGAYFDVTDETLLKTFAEYSSLARVYKQDYVQMNKNQILSINYTKLLKLYMEPCEHDFAEYFQNPQVEIPENFDNFNWHIPKPLTDRLPKYILYMFLKIVGSFGVILETTIGFILEVKKMHGNNPYHNFEHAFYSMHAVYLILRRNSDKFTDAEKKGLIIGALCHDVDHTGFSNNYLELKNDFRCYLYEYPYQENHHYLVTCRLLETFQLFTYSTPVQNNLMLEEIKHAILGTHVSTYFKIRGNLSKETCEKSFCWKDPPHRSHVKTMIMTACELSFCWKTYGIIKKSVQNYFEERSYEQALFAQKGKSPSHDFVQWSDAVLFVELEKLLRLVLLPCLEVVKIVFPNTVDSYNIARKLAKDIEVITTEKLWILEHSLPDVEEDICKD